MSIRGMHAVSTEVHNAVMQLIGLLQINSPTDLTFITPKFVIKCHSAVVALALPSLNRFDLKRKKVFVGSNLMRFHIQNAYLAFKIKNDTEHPYDKYDKYRSGTVLQDDDQWVEVHFVKHSRNVWASSGMYHFSEKLLRGVGAYRLSVDKRDIPGVVKTYIVSFNVYTGLTAQNYEKFYRVVTDRNHKETDIADIKHALSSNLKPKFLWKIEAEFKNNQH